GAPLQGLPAGAVPNQKPPQTGLAWVAGGASQLTQMSDFFFWTAWLSAANRPGLQHSYTNNWPYDPAAGNTLSWDAVLWSAVSVALLVLMLGLVYYVYNRYRLDMEDAYTSFPRLELEQVGVTESQRKTGKFFVGVALLFLAQALLGGLLSHYYVTGNDLYGFDISHLLPFNIARTWHLQLAILWTATAWLGMGLYVSPAVVGGSPSARDCGWTFCSARSWWSPWEAFWANGWGPGARWAVCGGSSASKAGSTWRRVSKKLAGNGRAAEPARTYSPGLRIHYQVPSDSGHRRNPSAAVKPAPR
ncbi:MAG: cbb3-type cytochrome c oxidase subunit I, partial [Firmicutes bacterium]|nr:cbb3-type cytochrome c oxidase subunit I [Bacillota bacterium]